MLRKLIPFLMIFFCLPLSAKTITLETFKLNNGLTLIVKPDHRAPVIDVQVWYKVGSSYEHNGITGISHALEHMMFEGTPTYPAGKFAKIIAANGGYQNATTGYDRTNYFEELASDKLALAFKLEADRMQHLSLTPASFKKEMAVVMEERRLRTDDNAQALTYERLMAAANISNPYHHAPIGWMNDIKQLTISDLKKWYHQWYAPNNAILVVVGDVKPQIVLTLAKKYFGNIPKKVVPVMKERPNQKPTGPRLIEVFAPAKLPYTMLAFATPSIHSAKIKWEPYALSLLSDILDGGPSARLANNVVRGSAIATSANAYYSAYKLYPTQFILSGVPSQKHSVKALQDALIKQIEAIQKQGVTQTELNRVITQVVADKVYSQDSISRQADELGTMAILGLPLDEVDHYIAMIKKITPKQIQEVARKYLIERRETIATLVPEQTPTPHNIQIANGEIHAA